MSGNTWHANSRYAGAEKKAAKLSISEQCMSLVLVGIIFAGILAFGADRNDLALVLTALLALNLAVLVLGFGWARTVLNDSHRLLLPGLLFLLTCLSIASALTAWAPGSAHPVWAYVHVAPAVTIDRSAVVIGLIKLCGLACAFLAAWIVCANDRRARYFFRVLIAASAFYGLWALFMHVTMPGMVLGAVKVHQGARLSGSFGSANTAGTFFGIVLIYALCRVVQAGRITGGAA